MGALRAAREGARVAAFALAGFVLAGCTTVGLPVSGVRNNIDFGPRARIAVCVLRDEGVSERRVAEVMGAIDREMDRYGLDVTVPWVRPWQRPAFFGTSILREIAKRPLEPPCDRLLALVGRNVGDALWSIVLPEYLGAVETTTHTRGYVAARVASVNQLFSGPEQAAVHEFYHMLGCSHALLLSGCYRQIALTKSYLKAPSDFFPGLRSDLQPILTRAGAN